MMAGHGLRTPTTDHLLLGRIRDVIRPLKLPTVCKMIPCTP